MHANLTNALLQCVNYWSGTVLAGKRSEMVFEYLPEEVCLSESFWRFVIADHDISVPFLIVGSVAEPDVFLERTHV